MKILIALALIFGNGYALAQERFELGLGAGNTHPVGGDAFKSAASSGDGQSYWLGYNLDENWAVELGYDNLDFDEIDSKHKAITLNGVYRFLPNLMVHPIAKFGLGSYESTSSLDSKTNSMGAKIGGGVEADFKYVSIGVLANFHHIIKSDNTADLKNTQAIVPILFLTLHNALGEEDLDNSQSNAEPATNPAADEKMSPPPQAKYFNDSDNDGVSNEDDKCSNTPSGVAVNKIGCAEKEKASVRLDVSFESGKTELNVKYESEIQKLADFMKRFADTKVEISGHTDSLGDPQKNQKLSELRAEAVKNAVVSAGIEESRLSAKGYGPTQPIADNKTKSGRDQNRRVTAEISIEVEKKK
jgi:OOP family OmpA-OmpF porin